MSDKLQNLIDALRDELGHYGEMLVLLDQQQAALTRGPESIAQSAAMVQRQGIALQRARDHREECRRATAVEFGLLETSSFADLIPRLAEQFRPLLHALVDENNELLFRVRRRARQNQTALERSASQLAVVMDSLRNSNATDTISNPDLILSN